jgi:hypothetical protein
VALTAQEYGEGEAGSSLYIVVLVDLVFALRVGMALCCRGFVLHWLDTVGCFDLPTNLFNKSSGAGLGFIEIRCFLNHLLVVMAIGRRVEGNSRSRCSALDGVVCM